MVVRCPFCTLSDDRVVEDTPLGRSIFDKYPVSPGHTLVVPKRHIASLFDATEDEVRELLGLLRVVRERLQGTYKPDAFNIGINDGPAAGQTVPHLHIHLIPRFAGDREDPRGGVRWIIPELADYWTKP